METEAEKLQNESYEKYGEEVKKSLCFNCLCFEKNKYDLPLEDSFRVGIDNKIVVNCEIWAPHMPRLKKKTCQYYISNQEE